MLEFKPNGIYFAFGRHSGEHIFDVPEDYLRWILDKMAPETEDKAAVREAARGELERRRHEGVGTFDFGDDE